MIEAIILAAGESRRMGRAKALLSFGSKTALALIVDTLNKAGISRIHVVVGHEAAKIIKESKVKADFVVNKNYKDGQFSSLQSGIASLSPTCPGVVVCLVDQPHILAEWVRALLQETDKTAPPIIRPKFGRKTGHPIYYGSMLFAEILAMPPTATAKVLMKKYYDKTAFVEVQSDAIFYDADTPADYKFLQRLLKKTASEDLPPEV